MSSAIPIIFTPPAPAPNLSLLHRGFWLAISAGCIALLLIAASLTPDSAGESTHTQLGLLSCQFLARTGIPCPSCGMTTSFALFVRGKLLASLWVQPFGLALAMIVTLTFWLALYMAVSAKPTWRIVAMFPYRIWLPAMMGLAVLAWGWKIFIHLRGIDGWR